MKHIILKISLRATNVLFTDGWENFDSETNLITINESAQAGR